MEEAKKWFVGKPYIVNEQWLLEKRIKELEEENIILKENIKIMKDIIVRLDKEVEVIKEKLDLDD